jgi:hypothetical protein
MPKTLLTLYVCMHAYFVYLLTANYLHKQPPSTPPSTGSRRRSSSSASSSAQAPQVRGVSMGLRGLQALRQISPLSTAAAAQQLTAAAPAGVPHRLVPRRLEPLRTAASHSTTALPPLPPLGASPLLRAGSQSPGGSEPKLVEASAAAAAAPAPAVPREGRTLSTGMQRVQRGSSSDVDLTLRPQRNTPSRSSDRAGTPVSTTGATADAATAAARSPLMAQVTRLHCIAILLEKHHVICVFRQELLA